MKKRVLFLCVANSCRSQMAEGLARHYFGDKIRAESAGYIATYVHPRAIQVMSELGIDISGHRSKNVAEFYGEDFDLVMTVCDEGDSKCPVWIGGGKKIHMGFYDPVRASGTDDEVLNEFRKVRDEMKDKIIGYLRKIV